MARADNSTILVGQSRTNKKEPIRNLCSWPQSQWWVHGALMPGTSSWAPPSRRRTRVVEEAGPWSEQCSASTLGQDASANPHLTPRLTPITIC